MFEGDPVNLILLCESKAFPLLPSVDKSMALLWVNVRFFPVVWFS
jgi:hypothetical protein